MNKFVLISAIFFILATCGMIAGGSYMAKGLNEGKSLAIDPISVAQKADGIYTGTYSGGRWTNEVNVTVKDGKITGIDVAKTVLFERPELTQNIISQVIQKQNTDIDITSGATVTSKAYLKSIENAFTK